ncbi:hypothetical protein AgCh_030522 [Apium graveolens]
MCYMNHRKFLEPTHKWRLDKNNFNGDIEMGQITPVLSGTDIEELLQGPAIFDMTKKEKEIFCSVLKNAKLPYGCASNISRYVSIRETEDTMSHSARNASLEYHIGTKKNQDGKVYKLKHADWKASHQYVIFNSGNNEIESLIREHRVLLDGKATSKRFKREKTHTSDFWIWLKEEVMSKDSISRDLEVLALGPNRAARRFTDYVVNGYRFHTKSRDSLCITQNSGVFVTVETTSFASSKDENPVVGNVNYYGSVEEIFELDYWGGFNVVLFKCCWYKEEKDEYGLTKVNFNKLSHKNDPYVLSSQVKQVFYVQDPIQKMVHYGIKKLPRDVCDAENENATEEEIRTTTLDDIDIDPGIEFEVGDGSCFRDDNSLLGLRLWSVLTVVGSTDDEKHTIDDTTVNVRLHYEGKFKKTSYIGGKHFIVMGLDVESFSYSVLMELVKNNLHFTEIGEIYANKGRKVRAPRKRRGPTKMTRVHGRNPNEKVVISLNAKEIVGVYSGDFYAL